MSELLLITGCAQLVTLSGPAPRRGPALNDLGIIRDGAVLIRDGVVAAVGPRREVEGLVARNRKYRRAEKLDLGGRVLLPGFVDSHTHLVSPASREARQEHEIGRAHV